MRMSQKFLDNQSQETAPPCLHLGKQKPRAHPWFGLIFIYPQPQPPQVPPVLWPIHPIRGYPLSFAHCGGTRPIHPHCSPGIMQDYTWRNPDLSIWCLCTINFISPIQISIISCVSLLMYLLKSTLVLPSHLWPQIAFPHGITLKVHNTPMWLGELGTVILLYRQGWWKHSDLPRVSQW